MIATDWTMSGIITVHWDGLLPAAEGKISMHMRRRTKYFLHVPGLQSTAKRFIEKIGYFDEEHFAYLEDTDIGYRARIYGYENWYAPKAIVYHVGSGTSGSRYNQFKTRYSSRNNIYLIYKNMPLLQIILNLTVSCEPGFL